MTSDGASVFPPWGPAAEMRSEAHCPHCRTPLPEAGWGEGLCPACLLELALSPVAREIEDDDDGPDDGPGASSPSAAGLRPGRVLGGRYRIRGSLGRGGMGEVWRGFDLKLRVDVALKALRSDLLPGVRAPELLRREVRLAREVASPNVCRVFDLVEAEGHELVSMEYVDGTTLAELLRERGPLPLDEAQEIASQLLAGLAAIHRAGLVHRDLKPENVMRTRSGRVVVMDLGIARWAASGSIEAPAGTPPYMAPEMIHGESVGPSADLFAAGVVLAEMVAPDGVASAVARRALWAGLRANPPEIAPTPWEPILRRAVERDPARRIESAEALARALEQVALRAAGDEDRHPYPGLASFDEKDAGFFFGREAEVEEVWRKLRRPGLYGLIGPSGTGKSSFLRAGLLPARPDGWGAVTLTPGEDPLGALVREVVVAREGDGALDRVGEGPTDSDAALALVADWRRRHEEALVVVDQFEELFTRNPSEAQEAFARLLSRLVLDAEVHVLLSMRDDFLFHCHRFEALRPLFGAITPLGSLGGAALRRALVQPGLRCGYRFEQESLQEAMVAEVEGERGALPLLAFASAQLWKRRDRDRGLLTQAAYDEIGGVVGALARHAESTLDGIGHERLSQVREIFRNLVTAEGTRASRDRDELLSVFPERDRESVAGILEALVASRLLVSYETRGTRGSEDGVAVPAAAGSRLEIVHESLLTRWPRLVRWRAQDEEGAVLRDQLRQAAQLWEAHGRADDYLWIGTAYREYRLWRERYPGGLTAREEAFAAAMTAFSRRRLRRRRLALASVFVLLAAALAAVTFSRQRAVAETRRAEASKILALGQLELEDNPTAALAYAIKSLELDDNPPARLFALRTLAAGAPAFWRPHRPVDTGYVDQIAFSPDGAWVALWGPEQFQVLSREGGPLRPLGAFPSLGLPTFGVFDVASDRFFAGRGAELRIWGAPDFAPIETQRLPGTLRWMRATRSGPVAWVRAGDPPGELEIDRLEVGRPPQRLYSGAGFRVADIDPAGQTLALVRERSIYLHALDDSDAPPRLVGRTRGPTRIRFHPAGDRLAALDNESGELTIWSTDPEAAAPIRTLAAPFEPVGSFFFDASGRRLALYGGGDDERRIALWDLAAPLAAMPRSIRAPLLFLGDAALSPDGRWIAAANLHGVSFWPLPGDAPIVLEGPGSLVTDVRFTPDGKGLFSADANGAIREWRLGPGGGERILARTGQWSPLDVDRRGRFIAFARAGGAGLVPLDGGEERALAGFAPETGLLAVAIDAEGRHVAAASFRGPREDKVIRVWDLETGEVRVLGPAEGAGEGNTGQTLGLGFLADGRLASSGEGGVRVWSIASGRYEEIAPCFPQSHLIVFPDGKRLVYVDEERTQGTVTAVRPAIADVVTGETRVLTTHGELAMSLAVDPRGEILVTGSRDGVVRVGPVSGEEPFLLIGHRGWVHTLDVSPDGRWIASAGNDGTIRIWPMPDLSRPPPQALPHDRLLARLRSLTNVRLVEASESSISTYFRTNRGGGWELDVEPFPGWAEVPEW